MDSRCLGWSTLVILPIVTAPGRVCQDCKKLRSKRIGQGREWRKEEVSKRSETKEGKGSLRWLSAWISPSAANNAWVAFTPPARIEHPRSTQAGM